jgi:hypothetical protein
MKEPPEVKASLRKESRQESEKALGAPNRFVALQQAFLGLARRLTRYHLLALVGAGGYYYGSLYSYFDNGPYHGGPYHDDGIRPPYACGFYGYC